MNLNTVLADEINIAKKLTEEELNKIGSDVVAGYENDSQSRINWEKDIVNYLKLSMQICEDKSFPWPGASNVKYPMIATAAMQFSARAYPTLVPNNGRLVNVALPGNATSPQKDARARNVSEYMSYQLLHEMDDWEDNMDNLLLILPIFGIAFKKIYYDPSTGQNCAKLVNPINLIVNYWAQELDGCDRITEVIYKTQREITEKIRAEIYLDVDLGKPVIDGDSTKEKINVSVNQTPPGEQDETTPFTLLEQHTFLDLDEDGYPEPYIVLVDQASRKVLRISPRFYESDIKFNDKGKVVSIKPTNYYVKYSFIPSPDGSFYTRGFGHLLGPLNESVNTILNQLIDAGTLSNLQSGFLGKGLKIRSGDVRFRPGEWKPVNNLGSDIKQNVYPLPVREPSNVLFQLLGMLVTSGKELASVAEIFTGKMPGQNTPAYTTQQTVEQGMKLFTAIYKRVYRSLTKEFKMLYALNAKYLDEADYQNVIDATPPATKADFQEKDKDILPTADPSASSDFEKQQKYQQVGGLLQLGTLNPLAYTQKMLANFQFSDAEVKELIQGSKATQPPQPSPEEKQIQLEMQQSQAESEQKIQGEQVKSAIKQKEAEFKLILKQQEATMDMKLTAQAEMMNQQFEALKASLAIQQQEQKHQQDLKHSAEMARAKQQQQPK